MLAARVSIVHENAREGQVLTDMILRDPDVRWAIEVVRADPSRWREMMHADTTSRGGCRDIDERWTDD